LTFFEWHFRNRPAGNQKAINLNADVFVSKLYPSLPAVALQQGGRIPLDLYLYGPGLAPEYNLQRKVIKHGAYKNWRLDGEFVHNPNEDPDRFNSLIPADLVILEFGGDPEPTVCRAFFIAQELPEDQDVHKALTNMIGGKAMVDLTYSDVEGAITQAKPDPKHPIHFLLLELDLEEASVGIATGIDRLASGPSGRKMDSQALRRARESADAVGLLGEEFVNEYLARRKADGEIEEADWVSQRNAIAPYDFKVRVKGGAEILADVKSTEGDFDRPLHVSLNELKQMALGTLRYDLYRVYELSDVSAQLRIVEDVGDFGKAVLDSLKNLPKGVVPDGFSFPPRLLRFNRAIPLKPPSGDEV